MDTTILASLEVEKQIINESINNKYYLLHAKPEYFLNSNTQHLFKIIQSSILKEEPYIDKIVESKLSQLYADCMMLDSYSPNPQSTIDKQKTFWLQHKAKQIVKSYSQNPFNDPQKDISELWSSLISIINGHDTELVEVEEVIRLFHEEQELYTQKQLEGKELIGYSTGYKKLDELADGLRSEHLWIVGGYTSAGKTFWSLNIVANLLKQGISVAFYSLEMSKIDVFGRVIGIISGINSRKILKGALNEEEKKKVENAKELVRKSGLRVHSEKNNLQEIMMSMNMEMITDKAQVFVLDYAQLITTTDATEYDTMRRLATELQAFCRKKKVPVILLSQVSNENAKSPESNIIGFKGSGALGASADVAIELVPADDKDTRNQKIANNEPLSVKLCVKKNRHGRIRNIINSFNGSCGQFLEDDLATHVEN
jgi:replicative DNA helicase